MSKTSQTGGHELQSKRPQTTSQHIVTNARKFEPSVGQGWSVLSRPRHVLLVCRRRRLIAVNNTGRGRSHAALKPPLEHKKKNQAERGRFFFFWCSTSAPLWLR